jgi:hypothetical protein
MYHQIEGAGRSKVRRPFLGLTPEDITAISARLDAGIRRNLGKST